MKNIRKRILMFAGLTVLCGTLALVAGEDNTISLDFRENCIVRGVVYLAPSAGDASAIPQVDGTPASGWSSTNPYWDSSSVADGQHILSIVGEEGTLKVLVLNSADIVIHEGVLSSDEVWSSDKIHIVRDWMRIPEDRRLVIANGAVVKFSNDSGILNQGMLSSVSAILTALEDDTVGGDTNLDEDGSSPVASSYAITGDGTLNAIGNELRYATPESVFASTTISENAFSGCSEITEIVIPADVVSIGGNAFGNCENLKRVTFQDSDTSVAENAFEGCSIVEAINFPAGLPMDEFLVGDSNPKVYVNDTGYPETWSGYTVVDMYASGILEKTLLVPAEEGVEGQVLTVTEDGYEWKDIPVDAELNAESTNAVQNKTVTAAITELQDADEALAGDVADLQSKDTELVAADADIQEDIAALQDKDEELAGAEATLNEAVTKLQAKDVDLVAADAAIKGEITTLQGNVNALQGSDALIQKDVAALQKKNTELASADTAMQGDISALKVKDTELASADTAMQADITALGSADTALQGSIDTLNTAKGTMQSDIATLQEAVEGLVGVPSEGGEAGQVLTKTEEGIEWQTINVTVDAELDVESENSVQNKVVTAAINGLREADTTMQGDISALKTKATELTAADTTMQGDISTLKTKATALEDADKTMQGDIAGLKTKDTELAVADATLKGSVDALVEVDMSIKADVSALKSKDTDLAAKDTALQDSIDALNTAKGTMQSDIATLQETVEGLIGVPSEGGEPGQVLTKTEEGIEWQDINVTVDAELDEESENSVQNKVVTAALNELQDADEALADDIADLQTVDTTLQGKVIALSDSVAGFGTTADNLSTRLNAQQTTISALQTTDTALNSSVSGLKSDVQALQGANTTTKGTLTALQSKDNELAQTDAGLRTDVNALQGNVLSLQSADSDFSTRLEAQQTAITALQSTDASLNSSIAEVQGNIRTLQTTDTTIKNSVTAVKNDVTALKDKDAELETATAGLRADMTALQGKDAELAQTDADLRTDVNAMQENVTDLQGADRALRDDVSELQDADEELWNAVNGMTGLPQEGGEVGQVLTVTEDGVAWNALPVADAELDAESVNAVQNKLVTAAVNKLKETDENLGGDISELSGDLDAQAQLLKDADSAQKNATSALQTAVNSQNGAVATLQSKAENAQLNINSLQVASDATQTTLANHLSSIEILQNDMGAAKSDIGTLKSETSDLRVENATLRTENQTLRNDVDALSQKVEALLAILNDGGKEWQVLTKDDEGGFTWMDSDAMGQEVLTLKLEPGWNLVAMPGRVVVSESEQPMLDQIEIYTFDKKQKVYVHSDGLKPLASYWMRAPEKCTIHFIVADVKPEEEEE